MICRMMKSFRFPRILIMPEAPLPVRRDGVKPSCLHGCWYIPTTAHFGHRSNKRIRCIQKTADLLRDCLPLWNLLWDPEKTGNGNDSGINDIGL